MPSGEIPAEIPSLVSFTILGQKILRTCIFIYAKYNKYTDTKQVQERMILMTEEIRNTLTEEVKKLIAAPSACAEAKATAEKWLAAAGTADEEAATVALKKEAEADIMPIDGLIGFAGSDAGKALFGEERAAALLAHAKDIKEKGARFCDCPACSACAEIIGTLK